MRKMFLLIAAAVPILLGGCGAGTSAGSSVLTVKEARLCDSLGVDKAIFSRIRQLTDSPITAFPANLENIPPKDTSQRMLREALHGILFKEAHSTSKEMVSSLYEDFQRKGYTIFIYDDNFGRGGDAVGVLKTADKYAVLERVQTDGINFGINNDSLLQVIRVFDAKYSLQLVGAGQDWCEFRIDKTPADWMVLAREVYAVCPDVVDQGTETVEKLADEMRRTRHLYFWWD